MYFTGDGGDQNSLVFALMLSSLIFDGNKKKLLTGILTGIFS